PLWPEAVASDGAPVGGFLEGPDRFDAEFFEVSPREAAAMDPQQRLFLEVAWQALEQAGQTRERLAGSRTGVFAGACIADYARLQLSRKERLDAYTLSGAADSIIANRLSYWLDLRGPSVAVDTACSSSLVVVHLACQSLRTGDSDLAIAGGVNWILAPDVTRTLESWGMLSPDHRLCAFDARANGFVRGEGCGVVVLKRLADAVADRDPVLAVIRGSAVNQDGRSNGLTAPNPAAQVDVIRRALAQAGLEPDDITYVEGHGTGTALGDPIEIDALCQVFRSGPSPARRGSPCWLGAVKANLGHLEAAAGVAGLIKTVLALRHRVIPGQVHFDRWNDAVRDAHAPFEITTAPVTWQTDGRSRCAGVSAFGFGGTNAHVVLEEFAAAAEPSDVRDGDWLLALSAQSPQALREVAGRYRDFLADQAPATGRQPLTDATLAGGSLGDICYTAAVRRTHHSHRIAVVAPTAAEMGRKLDGLLRDRFEGVKAATRRSGVLFVYSGQGTQWAGMGRDLLAAEPAGRAVIEQCAALIERHGGWSLARELTAPEPVSRLHRTEFAQPAIFA
ncbi:MAG: type I polyketide synthase, partial [Chloroflexota bacterium]